MTLTNVLDIAFWVCIAGLVGAGWSVACLIWIGAVGPPERTPEERKREEETCIMAAIITTMNCD